MADTSNTTLNESISSLIDGEHHELDLQRVIKAIDSDDSARQLWSRYHLIGAVMRREATIEPQLDISAAVMARIAAEPAVHAKRSNSRLWMGLGKTAVAATVTFGVVFGAQQYMQMPAQGGAQSAAAVAQLPAAPVDDSTQVAASSSAGAAVPQGFELPPLTARTVSTNPFNQQQALPRSPMRRDQVPIMINDEALQGQINRLLFLHAEQVSTSGGLGVIPFTRVSEVVEESKD